MGNELLESVKRIKEQINNLTLIEINNNIIEISSVLNDLELTIIDFKRLINIKDLSRIDIKNVDYKDNRKDMLIKLFRENPSKSFSVNELWEVLGFNKDYIRGLLRELKIDRVLEDKFSSIGNKKLWRISQIIGDKK